MKHSKRLLGIAIIGLLGVIISGCSVNSIASTNPVEQVNARDTVPVTPMVSQTTIEIPLPPAKILASDGKEGDRFGSSVSLSMDGNTAIIGAFNDDVGTNVDQGSAYIYFRAGPTWTQQQQLFSSDGEEGDNFGEAVSLSNDGKTAVIGAGSVGNGLGAAYVFVENGGVWTEQQQLLASDGEDGDIFGISVSISGDGNTALIGAFSDTVGVNELQGSAYVFFRTGTTWTEQAKLVADDGNASNRFGLSTSLSEDGNTALISADGYNEFTGATYVFVRDGNTWTQQQQLLANDGEEGDSFGSSVSLSKDGNTALIGAYSDDIGTNEGQGSVYIFSRNDSTWTQQHVLNEGSEGIIFGGFGFYVSLSGNGDIALIRTARKVDDQYLAYIFVKSGEVWAQQTQLTPSDGTASMNFGNSLSLSADGTTALVGNYLANIGRIEYQGSAWVFDLRQP